MASFWFVLGSFWIRLGVDSEEGSNFAAETILDGIDDRYNFTAAAIALDLYFLVFGGEGNRRQDVINHY